MSKSITTILVLGMSLVLLAFTGSRTLDLLQTLLPPGQGVFAWLGLVAFDGGLVGWELFYAYGARGSYQRAIALLMVIISLVAIGISTIADLYISAAAKGIVDAMGEQQRLAVLLAVGGVVFVNVAAGFLTHITDPERLRAMAVESANDQIHAATLAEIKRAAPGVAARIGPAMAERWVMETMQQHMPGVRHEIPSGKETLHLPAVKIESEASQNGHNTF